LEVETRQPPRLFVAKYPKNSKLVILKQMSGRPIKVLFHLKNIKLEKTLLPIWKAPMPPSGQGSED